MTREQILQWAQRCGFGGQARVTNSKRLAQFAALVAAAERENIAAWVEDMCVGLDAKTIANGIRNSGNDDMRAFEVRKD